MKRQIALLESGDLGDVMQAQQQVLGLYQDMSSKEHDKLKIIVSAERRKSFRKARISAKDILCFDSGISLHQQIIETMRLCRENNLENPWKLNGEPQKPIFHLTFVSDERYLSQVRRSKFLFLLHERICYPNLDWHIRHRTFSSDASSIPSTLYESTGVPV